MSASKMQQDIITKMSKENLTLKQASQRICVPEHMLQTLIIEGRAKLEVWLLASRWLGHSLDYYTKDDTPYHTRQGLIDLSKADPTIWIEHLQIKPALPTRTY